MSQTMSWGIGGGLQDLPTVAVAAEEIGRCTPGIHDGSRGGC